MTHFDFGVYKAQPDWIERIKSDPVHADVPSFMAFVSERCLTTSRASFFLLSPVLFPSLARPNLAASANILPHNPNFLGIRGQEGRITPQQAL